MRHLGIAVLAVGCSACSHLLQPTVTLSPAREAALPLRAALVMDERFRERVDEYGSFGTLGFAHKWNVATGTGLAPALEGAAKSVFADVRVVDRAADAQGVQVALYPEVQAMRHVQERGGFWFELVLRVKVMGASGGVLLDRTYREQAEGSSAAAFFGGVAAATPAVLNPTEEAMKQALEKFRAELRMTVAQLQSPPLPAAIASAAPGAFPPPPLPPPSSAGDTPPPPPPPPSGADTPLPPPSPSSGGDASCQPPCRRGFLCHRGACVSACNPPCAPGETCIEQGKCIAGVAPPPAGVAYVEPVREVEKPEPPDERPTRLAVHLNPLDAIMYGLTIGADVHLFAKLGLLLEGRIVQAGLFSYTGTFPFGPSKTGDWRGLSASLASGFGLTLGLEKFFGSQPGVRGFYLSANLELLNMQYRLAPSMASTRNPWREGTVVEWYVVPHGRLGYRWRWADFLFAMGVRGGAGSIASSTYTSSMGVAQTWATGRQVFIDVGLVLDMGAYFL